MNRADMLTVAELAVFLGLTTSAVRSQVLRHAIAPVGKDGRSNLYAARDFVMAVGGHDRTIYRKRRNLMQHLSEGDAMPKSGNASTR